MSIQRFASEQKEDHSHRIMKPPQMDRTDSHAILASWRKMETKEEAMLKTEHLMATRTPIHSMLPDPMKNMSVTEALRMTQTETVDR